MRGHQVIDREHGAAGAQFSKQPANQCQIRVQPSLRASRRHGYR
jgi:hypothetical protein